MQFSGYNWVYIKFLFSWIVECTFTRFGKSREGPNGRRTCHRGGHFGLISEAMLDLSKLIRKSTASYLLLTFCQGDIPEAILVLSKIIMKCREYIKRVYYDLREN